MNHSLNKRNKTGVVIIGRNEGDRLIRSLKSVINEIKAVVYVDSGSTDNSVSAAQQLGVRVVQLNMSIPFTAARARNAGFDCIIQYDPGLAYVQFVDGDCEVAKDWIRTAMNELEVEPQFGVVCGRRRERYPDHSVYNQLCDMEWDMPIGEVKTCGGDFMIRTLVFKEMNGFNDDLIAGEEPDLCFRIRQKGWKIRRIMEEMTLHDANITHIGQWWKRNVRAGYSYTEGAYIHLRDPGRHWVAKSFKISLWGFIIPVGIVLLSLIHPLFWALMIIYPVKVIRTAISLDVTKRSSWLYALFVVLGKFPEFQGQFKFLLNKLFKSRSRIIEYK